MTIRICFKSEVHRTIVYVNIMNPSKNHQQANTTSTHQLAEVVGAIATASSSTRALERHGAGGEREAREESGVSSQEPGLQGHPEQIES